MQWLTGTLTMSDIEKTLDRAMQAKALLDNPIYQESFSVLRETLHNAWENAPIRDTEGHHELKLMLKLLGDLERNIKRIVDDGKLAHIDIERKKNKWFERVA